MLHEGMQSLAFSAGVRMLHLHRDICTFWSAMLHNICCIQSSTMIVMEPDNSLKSLL